MFLLSEEVIVCFLQPDKIHQIIASVATQWVIEAIQFTFWIDVWWDVYGVLSITCWRSWEAAIATAGVRAIPLGLEPPNAIAGLEALVKCTRSVLLSYNCADFQFQELHDISSRYLHIWGRTRLKDGLWLILLCSQGEQDACGCILLQKILQVDCLWYIPGCQGSSEIQASCRSVTSLCNSTIRPFITSIISFFLRRVRLACLRFLSRFLSIDRWINLWAFTISCAIDVFAL